ncbi:muscle-specific protein 20 [Aplysia californica]|uniref:Muscle-specific protein 20 n=1 Tax=Aplysia californica TaxID=6500 RepID=A0ABM0ZVK4_APLCA|nr:muscle-specific protein 20 [Aplysia californica]
MPFAPWAEQKFDPNQARDVTRWMEAVLGRKLCDDVQALKTEHDFAGILKDGVALCELINEIQPGSVRRINKQLSPFKQMENVEFFTKACVEYGMNALDVFQITDLYEVKAVYTVFNCLHALGSLALKNGFKGPVYGVKIADKAERHFTEKQLAEGKRIIPMQAGSNRNPSQSGMTPYGFSRQIIPSDVEATKLSSESQNIVSLQYGTNLTANQSGMTPYGLGRQIVSMSSVSDDAAGSDAHSNSNSDPAVDKDLSTEDSAFNDEELF